MMKDESVNITEDVEMRDYVSGAEDEVSGSEVDGDYTASSSSWKKGAVMKRQTSPLIMMRYVSCVLVFLLIVDWADIRCRSSPVYCLGRRLMLQMHQQMSTIEGQRHHFSSAC